MFGEPSLVPMANPNPPLPVTQETVRVKKPRLRLPRRLRLPVTQGAVLEKKGIAYLAVDHGVDGREPARVMFAAWDEGDLAAQFDACKSKAWLTKSEVIVDIADARRKALAKLDGVDRLVLGLEPWPSV